MTSQSLRAVVGARVKFRDDHPAYPGMVGTVDEVIDLPLAIYVSITLDPVAATADEIEPWTEVPGD